MTRSRSSLHCVAAVALALAASPAFAQDRGPGFLDNLFNRDQGGGSPQQQQDEGSGSEVVTRLNRIESSLRQLTGTIEELQHRNQMLEQQVQQLQQRAGLGAPGQTAPAPAPLTAPAPTMAPPTQIAPPATPGRRSDVFDPARQPNAPGAPRLLGNETASVPSAQTPGAPLDLSSASQGGPQPPASPPRNAAVPGAQLATLPPSASPQDEFDMAYGYVLHKDYGLAVQAFRDFLRRHPDERLVPDAQFWLGDALFRQQQYREAAESFLAVSTKYEHSGKAPDALLKLGQSLAELHQKEAACATLAQVGRKYPQASAGVKRAATAELKKQHC